MIIVKRLIVVSFFLLSASMHAQYKIVVEVWNVPKSIGKINAALYDQSDTFLNFEEVYKSASTPAKQGKTEVLFGNIPEGDYAIALFYDENANNKLDTNWMGIPKEKVAFSNAEMKLFGPPSFKECSFRLNTDKTLNIRF